MCLLLVCLLLMCLLLMNSLLDDFLLLFDLFNFVQYSLFDLLFLHLLLVDVGFDLPLHVEADAVAGIIHGLVLHQPDLDGPLLLEVEGLGQRLLAPLREDDGDLDELGPRLKRLLSIGHLDSLHCMAVLCLGLAGASLYLDQLGGDALILSDGYLALRFGLMAGYLDVAAAGLMRFDGSMGLLVINYVLVLGLVLDLGLRFLMGLAVAVVGPYELHELLVLAGGAGFLVMLQCGGCYLVSDDELTSGRYIIVRVVEFEVGQMR